MIDHLIAEGTKMFAEANHKDTWMLYHDHQSIFWEKETIAYLISSEPPQRQSTQEKTLFDKIRIDFGERCSLLRRSGY